MCDHLGVPDTIPCGIKLDWDRPPTISRGSSTQMSP